MASITPVGSQTRIEDALSHLPISSITEYNNGEMIFGPERRANYIYLVVTGKVGISRVCDGGSEVLLEIVLPDELFGEAALLDGTCQSEVATAIGNASVMAWTISDIEDLVMQRPRLGIALLQILAKRNQECKRRIESLSLETIERRLARSLIRFSERLGVPEEDGSVRMMAFTHEMLSRYVGTSREIVTHYMNRFRKQGFVNYSRRGIVLYGNSLKAVLDGFKSTVESSQADRMPRSCGQQDA
jgi:CRP/FNR family cyclic AMP-dependent transcriptional regulator